MGFFKRVFDKVTGKAGAEDRKDAIKNVERQQNTWKNYLMGQYNVLMGMGGPYQKFAESLLPTIQQYVSGEIPVSISANLDKVYGRAYEKGSERLIGSMAKYGLEDSGPSRISLGELSGELGSAQAGAEIDQSNFMRNYLSSLLSGTSQIGQNYMQSAQGLINPMSGAVSNISNAALTLGELKGAQNDNMGKLIMRAIRMNAGGIGGMPGVGAKGVGASPSQVFDFSNMLLNQNPGMFGRSGMSPQTMSSLFAM